MKKLLLSSIIMFAVCSVATAQNDSKMKQKHPDATNAAAPAAMPQKAAVMPADQAVAAPTTDVDASTAPKVKPAVAKTDASTSVNAAGVVTPSLADKKIEAKKAAAKAANQNNK
jgi:hypothetical protein